jgi:hypothetical protein
MKKTVITLFVLIISIFSFAQTPNEVRGSMGIDFVSIPSLKDYLEANYDIFNSDFSSAVNFSVSYGRMFGETFQLQAEVGYLLNSFNSSVSGGSYDLTYSIIMPTILSFAVIQGTGYNFKFGGGAGIRFLTVDESFPFNGSKVSYSSVGLGLIVRAEGNTAIAENVYAYIGADVRYDILGEPSISSERIGAGYVDFSSLSFGVRLGISYQF